ncbi:MAG: metallophosphoesterase [Ferruginibacter sp.]
MRKLLQYLLRKPLTWLANTLSGAPQKEAVFRSLGRLYRLAQTKKNRRVIVLDILQNDSFIIFSDQHKGNKDSADLFARSEDNYIAALEYYHARCFAYINLGDCEELWKYKPEEVLPKVRKALAAEAAFQQDKKYFRTFGNHDLIWKNSWDVKRLLKGDFSLPLPVPEGILLRTAVNQQPLHIFLTHGHQGDKMSDNNAFSTWIVAHIWTPLQRYLQINENTPSKDDRLRNRHNRLMYEWSKLHKNLVLVTGHTHLPVFASGKYSPHPANYIETAEEEKMSPGYFNTGCCCFSDGDITGIEIENGSIRLIKWHSDADKAARIILEEITLETLAADLADS